MGDIIKTLNIKTHPDAEPTSARLYFDSGARISFIREDIARGMGYLLELPVPEHFYGVANGHFLCRHVMHLLIELEGIWCRHLVYVAPNEAIADEVLIGSDFMQKYKIKLDMEHEDLIIDREALKRALRLR